MVKEIDESDEDLQQLFSYMENLVGKRSKELSQPLTMTMSRRPSLSRSHSAGDDSTLFPVSLSSEDFPIYLTNDMGRHKGSSLKKRSWLFFTLALKLFDLSFFPNDALPRARIDVGQPFLLELDVFLILVKRFEPLLVVG